MTKSPLDQVLHDACEPSIFVISGYTRNKLSKDNVFKIYKSFIDLSPEPKFILYNKSGFVEFDLISLPFYISNKVFVNDYQEFKKFCVQNKDSFNYVKKVFFKYDIPENYEEFLKNNKFHIVDLTSKNFEERLIEYARS